MSQGSRKIVVQESARMDWTKRWKKNAAGIKTGNGSLILVFKTRIILASVADPLLRPNTCIYKDIRSEREEFSQTFIFHFNYSLWDGRWSENKTFKEEWVKSMRLSFFLNRYVSSVYSMALVKCVYLTCHWWCKTISNLFTVINTLSVVKHWKVTVVILHLC